LSRQFASFQLSATAIGHFRVGLISAVGISALNASF